jgi:uncharacterized protein
MIKVFEWYLMKPKNIKIPFDQVSELCLRWHITRLSLFGSILRDDFSPESDVDILVEFEPGFTPGFLKLYQIQEDLSQLFNHRTIDLVTLKSLNPLIRDRILASMELCYVAER